MLNSVESCVLGDCKSVIGCYNGYIPGWEYSTDGKCEKMPSTKLLDVRIKSLPCFEQEGMIWVWPGSEPPAAKLPSLQPPQGFVIHAEV